MKWPIAAALRAVALALLVLLGDVQLAGHLTGAVRQLLVELGVPAPAPDPDALKPSELK